MSHTRHRRASPLRSAALATLLALVGAAGASAAQEGAATAPRPRETASDGAAELLERLGDAWFARDFDTYLGLWDFASPDQREREAAAAREAFAAEETQLTVLGRPRRVRSRPGLSAEVQVFTATEPQGQVQHWRLQLASRGERWAIVGRESGGGMDGLIHLPLGGAWRARDVSLKLEDFELSMRDGSLFHTPEPLGPTALVFVGEGRVRFSPQPAGEREQLEQFSGDPQLDREVDWAFVRLHPADFGRVLDVASLEPDPDARQRREEAEKRWRERAPRSFVVDAALPRSPWWLSPSVGDAVVDFPWKGRRVLTYALARNEPEDVNLFERDRGLRICSYPSGGRPPLYVDDAGRAVDVLRHDLVARFDPIRRAINAVHTLRLRMLQPVSNLRLKLDDDLRVSSVSAQDGQSLLFLRVREQDSLVVSLGTLAGQADELSLTVRYSGVHDPAPMTHELLQLVREPEPIYVDRALLNSPPIVYSNRSAWYPRPDNEDYAPLRARLDAPDDMFALTGGELVSTRTAEGRVITEYRMRQPGKYFTALVGRLENVGMRQEGEQAVRGFADPRSGGETREAMERAIELLAFFAERYGPCPYPLVNLAIAEATVPAGHSPPGLVYLQRRPAMLIGRHLPEDPASFGDLPDFFLAHELAHQWWGQGTAPANYREQWLSEAWAQYSAALWIRHRGGEGAFVDMLDRMGRWARRHDQDGAIHLGQRLGHLKRDPRILRAVVYNKGAWVLHMLRGLVGDEAFFGAARAFLDRHRFAKAGTEDLRAALEQASGRDLGPYFDRWIYGRGLPTLHWTKRTEETPDGHRTTVEIQTRDMPGPLPLEIAVTTRQDREARRVMVDPDGGVWTIDTVGSPRDVEVNADRGLLAETKQVRRLPRRAQR